MPELLRCVSEFYDDGCGDPYHGVEDFLQMCREVFGQEPLLVARPDGTYHDGSHTVLIPENRPEHLKA